MLNAVAAEAVKIRPRNEPLQPPKQVEQLGAVQEPIRSGAQRRD